MEELDLVFQTQRKKSWCLTASGSSSTSLTAVQSSAEDLTHSLTLLFVQFNPTASPAAETLIIQTLIIQWDWEGQRKSPECDCELLSMF